MKLQLYACITLLLSSHYITSSYYDDYDSDAETVVEQYHDNRRLLLAVQENDYELLKSILSMATLDVINKFDEDGFNALHYATYNGNDKIVGLLLEHGADPNICELNEGNSPLIIAVDLNHLHIVIKLIDYGADINIYNCHGRSVVSYIQSDEMEDLLDSFKYNRN